MWLDQASRPEEAPAGRIPVIPPKANRSERQHFDRQIGNAQHLIKNVFAKLKQFVAIARRYDEPARNLLGAVPLAPSAPIGETPSVVHLS